MSLIDQHPLPHLAVERDPIRRVASIFAYSEGDDGTDRYFTLGEEDALAVPPGAAAAPLLTITAKQATELRDELNRAFPPGVSPGPSMDERLLRIVENLTARSSA